MRSVRRDQELSIFQYRPGNQLINSLLTGYKTHLLCDKISMSRDKNVKILNDVTFRMTWFAIYCHIFSGPISRLISKPVLV